MQMADQSSEASSEVPGISEYSESGGYSKEYVRQPFNYESGESLGLSNQNSSEGGYNFLSSSEAASQTKTLNGS